MLDRDAASARPAAAAGAPPASRSAPAGGRGARPRPSGTGRRWTMSRRFPRHQHEAAEQGRRRHCPRAADRTRPAPPPARRAAGPRSRTAPAASALTAAAAATADGGRAAHARADRHALVDRQPDAEIRAGRVEQRPRGGQSGIGRGRIGQARPQPAHRAEPDAGRRLAHRRHPVAHRIEGEAEHVEADTDIADAGAARWPRRPAASSAIQCSPHAVSRICAASPGAAASRRCRSMTSANTAAVVGQRPAPLP